MKSPTNPIPFVHVRPRLALRALPLLAAGLLACEAEPVDEAPTSAELVAPAEIELTSADLEVVLEFADQAEVVFVGEVVEIGQQLSEPDADGVQWPFTLVTWAVEDGIEGVGSGERYSARFLGGAMPDGKVLSVSEIPEFEVGDRDLLFITGNGRSAVRWSAARRGGFSC